MKKNALLFLFTITLLCSSCTTRYWYRHKINATHDKAIIQQPKAQQELPSVDSTVETSNTPGYAPFIQTQEDTSLHTEKVNAGNRTIVPGSVKNRSSTSPKMDANDFKLDPGEPRSPFVTFLIWYMIFIAVFTFVILVIVAFIYLSGGANSP